MGPQITTSQEAKTALERHITTQVLRYRGKIWAWDVINEAIEPEDRLDNGYRNSVWFRSLGVDYIDRHSPGRAADPAVPLCLSEYGIEYATAASQRRREALLGCCKSCGIGTRPSTAWHYSRIWTRIRFWIIAN